MRYQITDDGTSALTVSIANSNTALDLFAGLVISVGNIQENTGPTSLLLPIRGA